MDIPDGELYSFVKSVYDFIQNQDAKQERAKMKKMPKIGEVADPLKGGPPAPNRPGTGVAKMVESDETGTSLSEASTEDAPHGKSASAIENAADDIEDLDELELPEDDEEEEEEKPSSKSGSSSSSSKSGSSKSSTASSEKPSSSSSGSSGSSGSSASDSMEIKSIMKELTKTLQDNIKLSKELEIMKGEMQDEVRKGIAKEMKRAGFSSVSRGEVVKLGVDQLSGETKSALKDDDKIEKSADNGVPSEAREFIKTANDLSGKSWATLAEMRVSSGEIYGEQVYWKPDALLGL
jgi:hypothetical protein